MSDDRTWLATRAINYLRTHFPGLNRRMPDTAEPFSLGYGVVDGASTHPVVVDPEWCASRGYEGFLDADVPGEFFLAGVQNRGTAEYLLVMMTQSGRRFWFYDTYVCFVAKTERSKERTREALEAALVAWDRGDQCVVYSGPHKGWVDGNKDENGIPWL